MSFFIVTVYTEGSDVTSFYTHGGASMKKFRIEHDSLGEKQVPVDAYYGVQTVRAMENFVISNTPISAFPEYIKALGYIKKACALANMEFKILDKQIGEAIISSLERWMTSSLSMRFRAERELR